MAAKINIDTGLVISIKDLQLNFNIKEIINSTIGDIPTTFLSFVLTYLQIPLVALIRFFLNSVSLPLGWIINSVLGINWFNF